MTEHSFAAGTILLTLGPIATLTLNAPQRRNAMSNAMWQGLIEGCGQIARDPAVQVVILRGAGGHFCAGADIAEFETVYRDPSATAAYNQLVRQAQAQLRGLAVPVLAQIEGACVGGGCGLALAADLRFAAQDAKFGITPSRLGLAYSPEDTAQLIEKTGPARAKDLLFSARLISGQDAYRYGLIDFIAGEAGVSSDVLAYAEELAARSPASLRATKAIVEGLIAVDRPRCDDLRPLYEATFRGADFDEGRRAFLAKRSPQFRKAITSERGPDGL